MIKETVYKLGDNINTDQVLTAEFMKINPSTDDGYKELGSLAMCGLTKDFPPFIDEVTKSAIHKVIVAGENFGCGSSREHAPIALGASGVKAIVAKSFARIFYRNCISTGEILPLEVKDLDLEMFENGSEVEIDLDTLKLRLVNNEIKTFTISDFGDLSEVIKAGGLFSYAKKNEIF